MRFTYSYKTSDGVRHDGEIRASSANDVYAELKRRGIRPFNVVPSPGLVNKLLGVSKRWVAIVLLAVVAVVLAASWSKQRRAEAESDMYELRSQIYGDPGLLRVSEESGWTNVFHTSTEIFLARYAIPGRVVREGEAQGAAMIDVDDLRPIGVGDADFAEVKKMKRMVNTLKRELSQYLADGGTVAGYVDRLRIRQIAERSIYERIRRELLHSDDLELWRKRNVELRAQGLPMVSEVEKEGVSRK